jgi:hypothetical protein
MTSPARYDQIIREMFPDADPERPLFPGAEVELSSRDGNSVAIMMATRRALRRAGATEEQLNVFQAEAMSGDAGHVLSTCMEWAEVS